MNNKKVEPDCTPLIKKIHRTQPGYMHLISSTLRDVLRFGAVGIIATAIHLGIALSLNIVAGFSPLASNTIAFLCALLASYLGNLKWAFGAQEHNAVRAGKFLITACIGFLVNSAILAFLVNEQIMSDPLAIVVSVFCVPLITFVTFKFWVFKR